MTPPSGKVFIVTAPQAPEPVRVLLGGGGGPGLFGRCSGWVVVRLLFGLPARTVFVRLGGWCLYAYKPGAVRSGPPPDMGRGDTPPDLLRCPVRDSVPR